jgi:hypothetical protein
LLHLVLARGAGANPPGFKLLKVNSWLTVRIQMRLKIS